MTGYIKLLLSDYGGQAFNIGTETPEINMIDLANKVIEVTSTNKKLIFKKSEDVDYVVDNPNRRCPDITKAKKLLKFNPKISIEDGLERTWSYYKNNPTAQDL